MARTAKRTCNRCDEPKLISEFYVFDKYTCKSCRRDLANQYNLKQRRKKLATFADRLWFEQAQQESEIKQLEKLATMPGAPRSLASRLISLTDDYLDTRAKGFTNLAYLR